MKTQVAMQKIFTAVAADTKHTAITLHGHIPVITFRHSDSPDWFGIASYAPSTDEVYESVFDGKEWVFHMSNTVQEYVDFLKGRRQ